MDGINDFTQQLIYNRLIVKPPHSPNPLRVFPTIEPFSGPTVKLVFNDSCISGVSLQLGLQRPSNEQQGPKQPPGFNPAATQELSFRPNHSPPHGEAAPSFHRKRHTPKTETTTLVSAVRVSWNSHEGHGKPFIHLLLLLRTHSFLPAEGENKTRRGRSSAFSAPSFARPPARLLRLEETQKKEAADDESPSRPSIYYSASAVIGYRGEYCCWNDGLMLYFGSICVAGSVN